MDGHNLYEDEPAARRALTYLPDVPPFYHELTASERISFIAQAHGAADEGKARQLQSRLKSAPPTC